LAILVALLGMIVPSLARLRVMARQVGSLSNVRQHAAIFHLYGADHAGFFPFLTDPAAEFTVIRSGTVWAYVRYFDISLYWSLALAGAYYEGDFRSPSFLSSADRAISNSYIMNWINEYVYSNCCIADPKYWRPETRMGDRSQWRAVGFAEVTHPPKKGMLIDYTALGRSFWHDSLSPTPVGFIDGSARAIPENEFLPWYRDGNGDPAGNAFSRGFPVMHTIGGVHGRDVR
jgi:hypothetical protein